jgi:hypothetical protein
MKLKGGTTQLLIKKAAGFFIDPHRFASLCEAKAKQWGEIIPAAPYCFAERKSTEGVSAHTPYERKSKSTG